MKKTLILSFIFSVFFYSQSLAQNSKSGKIGIGYSGIFTSSTNDFNLSFWLGERFILEPQFGFQHIDVDDNKGTNWKLGVGALFVLNDFDVTPYLGGRIKTILLSGGEKTYNDLVLSFVFGGEYFVSEWFSVGAEMRLNYISTDKDFSPAYSIADATIIQSEQVINIKIYLK